MIKNSGAVRNIWMVTREFGELAGAGGVKDVTAQLSRALAKWTGRKVSVVLPCYGFIDPVLHGFLPLADPDRQGQDLFFEVRMNYVGHERLEGLTIWHRKIDRVHVYLLDSPRFREKGDVYTYTGAEEEAVPDNRQGEGHFDYFAMNLLLQKGALQLILLVQEKPEIIHCHDGHTAVLPAIIRETPWLKSYFRNTGFLVTIHNAGVGYHQEVEDLPFAHAMTGLPWRAVLQSRLQGRFDPLVCAGFYANVNTVSENYARELQETVSDEQTGWLGHHLKDVGVMLEGITNGVDPALFSPLNGNTIGIAACYDPRDANSLSGKQKCKADLLGSLAQLHQQTGVVQHGVLSNKPETPLFTFIGRLSEQKGIDILLEAVQHPLMYAEDFQLVILGRGTAVIEQQIAALAEDEMYRGRVCFLSGYDTTFANRVYSGGDFFLVPSRYEPCGLTDFIAQLFGNLPVVHSVGGLVKVIDGDTGFCYAEHSPAALAGTMGRAIEAYRNSEIMQQMQKRAVDLIDDRYTWQSVKNHYLQLYKKAIFNSSHI